MIYRVESMVRIFIQYDVLSNINFRNKDRVHFVKSRLVWQLHNATVK